MSSELLKSKKERLATEDTESTEKKSKIRNQNDILKFKNRDCFGRFAPSQ